MLETEASDEFPGVVHCNVEEVDVEATARACPTLIPPPSDRPTEKTAVTVPRSEPPALDLLDHLATYEGDLVEPAAPRNCLDQGALGLARGGCGASSFDSEPPTMKCRLE